jgi:hypothetical protein
MENKPQTPDTTRQAGNTGPPREAADPRRQAFACDGSATDTRVSEPAVETDGQLAEAGYGHGV